MSRKGKRKVKKVTLLEFIGSEEAPNLSSQSHFSRGARRDEVMLPQGPRASRAVDVDLSRLPDKGPFSLLISNLSYDSDEDNLKIHLGNIKGLLSVKWNMKEDGRRDGTAVVVFETRDGAVAALGETDTIFGGRKIVINVAEFDSEGHVLKESLWRNRDSGSKWDHDLYPQRGGWREGRGRSRYEGDEGAEPGDDWRSRSHSNTYHGDRERRDSADRDSWRSLGERDRYPSGQRFRGRGGRGHSPRRSSPHGDHSPEGGRWSYSRGREDRGGRNRSWRGRGDGSFRRPYDRENSDEPDSWRRSSQERPERTDGESPRPLPEPERREKSASGGKSIFGGAKPVDTASREREMEEKISRLSVRSPSSSEGGRGQNRPQRGRDREQDDFRRPRGEMNEDRKERGYRGDKNEERGYRGERYEERGYRGDRNEGRGYRGDRNEERGYRGDRNEERGYKGDRNEERGYRGERRDRRGNYRDEGDAEGVRGPKRAPEERRGGKSAPRGTFKEQEQPEFARNTRFSLLENEDSVD